MSDFEPGYFGRSGIADEILQRAFAAPPMPPKSSFVPGDLVRPEPEPVETPKHFSPADRSRNPTEGWDPFDPEPKDDGFVDPVAAARTTGYAEGLAAGRAEAEAERARDQGLIGQVSAALGTGAHFDRERIAANLRQTVLHLVTRMIGETGIAQDVLARRIEAAVRLIADDAESALLRLHPEDVPMVEGRLPDRVFAVGDPHLARGAFVIESASTLIEDSPELWLDQLAQTIDRIPLPPSC